MNHAGFLAVVVVSQRQRHEAKRAFSSDLTVWRSGLIHEQYVVMCDTFVLTIGLICQEQVDGWVVVAVGIVQPVMYGPWTRW